jgi:hypothetical protein
VETTDFLSHVDAAVAPLVEPRVLPAAAFAARFAGLTRAHGRHILSAKPDARGKRSGQSVTVPQPATEALWDAHLGGTYSLGVAPLGDDGTVRWGAIDIDQYDGLDLCALDDAAQSLELPLVTVRSKSGGAHLLLFLTEDVPARVVRRALHQWAAALWRSSGLILAATP